jgi:hypothetical protein
MREPRRGARDGGYTASLCRMTMQGEVVPYQHASISAVDDRGAIQEATQWAATLQELLGDETWLVVKCGGRAVHVGRL